MRPALVTLFASIVLGFGCAHRAPTPPPPRNIDVITVLPPSNRTGDPLTIAGASFLERYALRSARVTVPDAIAEETAAFLRARGYRVSEWSADDASRREQAPANLEEAIAIASRTGIRGFALYLEIRRWEPDAGTHPAFVIAGVSAALIDVATGRTVWSVSPPVHPLPTPGTVVLGDAYEIAARRMVSELFASW